MDEKKLNLSFSVISTPEAALPEFSENTNSRTYVNWGADNAYPNFINSIYRESATVRSIIDGTVEYIVGDGVITSEDAAMFRAKINRRNETFEDLVGQLGLDLLKYEGFAIEVIFNKLNAPVELYALDMSRIRLSSDGKKVYYSNKTWGQYTSKFEEYDAFGQPVKPEKPQIYVYKGRTKNVYPYSSWEGAFRDALAEIYSSKYVLNNMMNGLSAKHLISIPDPGNLSEDDKDAVESAMQTKFVGPDALSSIFLYWQQGDKQLKIDSIATEDESQKFDTIRKAARQNIFVAFRATPVLFGLMTETTGFSEQEFGEAFKLYNRTVVAPMQRKIIKAIDKILGTKNAITIKKFDINFEEGAE